VVADEYVLRLSQFQPHQDAVLFAQVSNYPPDEQPADGIKGNVDDVPVEQVKEKTVKKRIECMHTVHNDLTPRRLHPRGAPSTGRLDSFVDEVENCQCPFLSQTCGQSRCTVGLVADYPGSKAANGAFGSPHAPLAKPPGYA
jgi:hypothetical protein